MGSDARAKLERYIPLAEFLSKCYGDDVEVVLHDIANLEHSAIAIYNNHVSGREMGAPMTYFGLKIIREKMYAENNFVIDRKNVLNNGKVLRSSTYFIKDDDGSLLGTLCINVDVSKYVELMDLFEKLAYGKGGAEEEPLRPKEPALDTRETFPTTVEDLIQGTIREFVGPDGAVDDLTVDRKIELVSSLSEKGIFMFKGTVKKVSQALGVSEPTVYRYLNSANNP